MKILLDHDVPAPLRHYLVGHFVDTAREKGWERLNNGDLLTAAEEENYDMFITADQSIRFQQNLARRQLRVLVLLGKLGRRFARELETSKKLSGSLTLAATLKGKFEGLLALDQLAAGILPFTRVPNIVESYRRCLR